MSRLVKVALVPRRKRFPRRRKAPGDAGPGKRARRHAQAISLDCDGKSRRCQTKRKRTLTVGRSVRPVVSDHEELRFDELGLSTGECLATECSTVEEPVRKSPSAVSSGRGFQDGVIVEGILDQKARLWRRYRRTRSFKLRNTLTETYLPLVQAIADRVASRLPVWVDRNDLVGAGVFGLLKAIERFDPGRGTRFESYCQARVHGAILDELRRQDWLSRPSRHRGLSVHRARQRLVERIGREPSPRELADHLGISLSELRAREVESSATQLVSLDAGGTDGSYSGESTAQKIDLVDPQDLPSDVAHRRELIGLIESNLSGIERVIVVLHYHENMKLKQVAHLLNRSNSRITQIHNRLLRRLKERLSCESV